MAMAPAAAMIEAVCRCGHGDGDHSLFTSCDVEGCPCPKWSPASWLEEVVGTCICGDPVTRTTPRIGIMHAGLAAICHLDCAPEQNTGPSPWEETLAARAASRRYWQNATPIHFDPAFD